VKGKDVFVNGKKVDAGEEIVLDGAEASHIYFNGDGSEYAYSYEQAAREMELVEKEMAAQEKLYEQEQKRWEQEQKNWEKEQKQWEKEQRAWEKEQKKWEKEQKDWEARNRELEVMLKKELLNDGLISNNKPFSIKLDSKEMWLNNVKQSEEIRKKYSALIEKKGGIKLGGSNSFFFNFEH
jgi:ATPase subunit of ABC transporter with duplicated ATPase domains